MYLCLHEKDEIEQAKTSQDFERGRRQEKFQMMGELFMAKLEILKANEISPTQLTSRGYRKMTGLLSYSQARARGEVLARRYDTIIRVRNGDATVWSKTVREAEREIPVPKIKILTISAREWETNKQQYLQMNTEIVALLNAGKMRREITRGVPSVFAIQKLDELLGKTPRNYLLILRPYYSVQNGVRARASELYSSLTTFDIPYGTVTTRGALDQWAIGTTAKPEAPPTNWKTIRRFPTAEKIGGLIGAEYIMSYYAPANNDFGVYIAKRTAGDYYWQVFGWGGTYGYDGAKWFLCGRAPTHYPDAPPIIDIKNTMGIVPTFDEAIDQAKAIVPILIAERKNAPIRRRVRLAEEAIKKFFDTFEEPTAYTWLFTYTQITPERLQSMGFSLEKTIVGRWPASSLLKNKNERFGSRYPLALGRIFPLTENEIIQIVTPKALTDEQVVSKLPVEIWTRPIPPPGTIRYAYIHEIPNFTEKMKEIGYKYIPPKSGIHGGDMTVAEAVARGKRETEIGKSVLIVVRSAFWPESGLTSINLADGTKYYLTEADIPKVNVMLYAGAIKTDIGVPTFSELNILEKFKRPPPVISYQVIDWTDEELKRAGYSLMETAPTKEEIQKIGNTKEYQEFREKGITGLIKQYKDGWGLWLRIREPMRKPETKVIYLKTNDPAEGLKEIQDAGYYIYDMTTNRDEQTELRKLIEATKQYDLIIRVFPDPEIATEFWVRKIPIPEDYPLKEIKLVQGAPLPEIPDYTPPPEMFVTEKEVKERIEAGLPPIPPPGVPPVAPPGIPWGKIALGGAALAIVGVVAKKLLEKRKGGK